jgi:hypothetical protein
MEKMKQFSELIKSALITIFLFQMSWTGISGQDNKGNPLPHFLFPSFREGYVKMKDGNDFTALLNYHMIDEIMITEVDGVYRYSKNPRLIDTVYIENRVFVPVGNVFYELLAGGPVSIFLENRSNYTPLGADIGYGARSKSVGRTEYRRFELSDVMYQLGEVVNIDLPPNVEITPASVFWVRKDGDFEKFNNEKQFLEILPGFENELKAYIRKEKIRMKSHEDLAKLGEYCNKLINK